MALPTRWPGIGETGSPAREACPTSGAMAAAKGSIPTTRAAAPQATLTREDVPVRARTGDVAVFAAWRAESRRYWHRSKKPASATGSSLAT